MYSISPLVPVYDENQTYGYGLTDMSVDGTKMEFPTNRNVMADDHYKDRKYTGYDITGNIGLTMKLAPVAYIQNKLYVRRLLLQRPLSSCQIRSQCTRAEPLSL